MVCSVASVLGALEDRWGALIMRDLFFGLRRFDDICRSTGATTATLADRLRKLERAGLVRRERYQTGPDRYEYVPTPKGWDVRLALNALSQIGDGWNVAGLDGPPLILKSKRTGNPVRIVYVDAVTGDRLESTDVTSELGPGADEITRWRYARGTQARNG